MSNPEVVHARKPIALPEYGDRTISWTELGIDGWNAEDRQLAGELRGKAKIDILELRDGIRIKADSRVGHVTFSSFDLVIRPKFDHLDVGHGKISPLSTLLAYAFNFENLNRVGEQRLSETYFAEILIYWLIGEVHNIQRRGLFQQYRRERRDLSVIRGKIDVKTWLRRGGIPSERMPCVFYRRSLDNVLNQTLCAGLRRSVAIAKSPELKSKCRYLADDFALFPVTDRTLDYRMLADARRDLNRLNTHYENAVRIVEMLYAGSGGFVLGDPHREQIRIPGFFFDMNDLFEKVIGKFLKDNLPSEYKVGLQNEREVFFAEKSLENKPPSIRPDIIVRNGESEIVLDTKYKPIENGNPSNADLYQLSVYAMTCSRYQEEPKRRARIVYPADSRVQERRIGLCRSRHTGGGDLCEITLHPVNMLKLAETIDEGSGSEKQAFALEIIGK